MSYPATLDVIARLHVDGPFRAAFRADPERALERPELTEPERLALRALHGATLDRIARLADFHRLMRMQEHLPWLELARPGLRELVARYFTSVAPRLTNRDEAVAFCAWLENDIGQCPPYLRELALLDRLRLALAWGMAAAPDGLIILELVYPILQIRQLLLDQPATQIGWPELAPRATRVELRKVPGLPAVLVR
jgi:hypothetical protein